MLVIPAKRKVVLNSSENATALAVMPHAKALRHNGEDLLAVHHGVEEALVLKNIGIDVPPPILEYYNWPGRFAPMAHQKDTAAFLTSYKRALCLNSPGTGKSVSALWAADFLLDEGLVTKVLIVAPLSTLKPVWGHELKHHFPHRSFAICTGSKDKRKQILETPGVQYVIINHDGMTNMQADLTGFGVVIYDECFVAGTKVATPEGEVAIETMSVGDEILTSAGVRRVKRLKCTTSTNLVTIRTSHGHTITCTAEHPFFTDVGWVDAKNLVGRRLISSDDLSHMREGVSIPEVRMDSCQKTGGKLGASLLAVLQVEEDTRGEPRAAKSDESSGSARESCSDVFGEQTCPFSGVQGENLVLSESRWAQTCSTRGEWNGGDEVRTDDSGHTPGRVLLESRHLVADEAARLSELLQSGLGYSGEETSYRGGWELTQHGRAQVAGYKEGHEASGVWVVGVSHDEQASGVLVYNLEVAGTPNYFAGGALVHNCTAIKSPSAQRYKVFAKWVNLHNPWLWMLTGTPISQSPADAWTLARLAESKSVSRSFTAFRDQVMQKITAFKWAPRPNALEICRQVLQPSIRFSLDECKDLPQTNFVGRQCALTTVQEKAFKEMRDKAVTVFAGGEVTAANAAVMLGKLIQIVCGAVISDAGVLPIDSSPRYALLTGLLDEIGDKVIIFVPLKGVQHMLMGKLKADGYDVALVNGDVGKTERDQIFNDFQYADTPRILLAHPKVAAHGLTLTRAKDIIWYAPIYSLEQYTQANARIRRLSTTGKTTVWHIWATTFEKELYRRLRHKLNTLTDFLSLVNGVNID